jgi:hypothetical protein
VRWRKKSPGAWEVLFIWTGLRALEDANALALLSGLREGKGDGRAGGEDPGEILGVLTAG